MPTIFQSWNYVSGTTLAPSNQQHRQRWQGICAAMVGKWLKNILIDKRPLASSNPADMNSQQGYVMSHAMMGIHQQASVQTASDIDSQIGYFCGMYGLTFFGNGATGMDNVVECLEQVFPTLFVHVELPNVTPPDHAIALAKIDGKYYVFDPNRGLMEFDTVNMLKMNLRNWFSPTGWECRSIAEDIDD